MRFILGSAVAAGLVCGMLTVPTSGAGGETIDLAARLAAGKLRPFNRDVTKIPGPRGGEAIHVSEREGMGVVWIEGTDFSEGTIEVEIRGRDQLQRSFVGIAFHAKDDTTYEGIYLRPFNFRTDDPVRRQHAVQYISQPDYPWARLRKEFPEEFENPVDPSIEPTAWVPLKIVVKGATVQAYVGGGTTPTLEVRRLSPHNRGMIGLWTGTQSDGAFANLRITPRE
jgi:hypothetical protein